MSMLCPCVLLCILTPTNTNPSSPNTMLISPKVGIILGHFDNTHTPSQTTVVHATHNAPAVGIGIVYLHSLQVCGAIKSSNCHQLAIHHCKSHLQQIIIRFMSLESATIISTCIAILLSFKKFAVSLLFKKKIKILLF